MSRYGLVYFGSDPVSNEVTYYGEAVENQFDATPFEVVSNDYGKALATWRRPAGPISAQRLLRNPSGFPLHEQDGTLLREEVVPPSGSVSFSNYYQDEGLTPGRFYYYALYVFDANELIWRRAGAGQVLVAKQWGYTNRLYSKLPEVFKAPDFNSVDQALVADENSFLYRYLSIVGFQLDHVRTEYDTLRRVLDASTVSNGLLPALAAQVGFPYEPELGSRGMRRLVQNAVHLWAVKGTLPGIRELASLVMGVPAAVRIGRNIALDDLDAGPKGGLGRWRARDGSNIDYVVPPFNTVQPIDTGVAVVTRATSSTELVCYTAENENEPAERKLTAIPIIEGKTYVGSQYVQSASGTARVGFQFLNARGEPMLADPFYDGTTTLTGGWDRAACMAVAIPGSRYLEVSVLVEGAPASARLCGFMVQEDTALAPWQCAREILVYLEALIVNHVGNTSGKNDAAGWSAGTVRAVHPDGQPYLMYSTSGGPIALIDDDGIAVPDGDDPAPSGAGDPAVYTDASPQVFEGETWTSLASVTTDSGSRQVRVGWALYDNGSLVGYQWGDRAPVNSDGFTEVRATFTVPQDATYDSISLALDLGDGTGYGFRKAALERADGQAAFAFDGATLSATGDFLWEGAPYASPTHYYPRRTLRARRLRELLADYLPYQSCYALAFAQAVIPDSPLAVSGDDIDPSAAPPIPPSGKSATLRWNVISHAGNETALEWRTLANPPKIHDTFSRSIPPSQTDIGVGEDGVPWTLTCSGGAYWGDNALSGRDSNSNGGITTMRPAGDAGSTTGSAYISKQLGPPVGGTLYDVTVVNYRYSSGGSDEMRIYNADGSYFSFGWDGYNLGYHSLTLHAADNSILQTIGNVPGWGFIPGAGTLRMTYDTGSKLATMSLNGNTLISDTVTAANPAPDHFRYSSVGDNTPTGALDSWLLSVVQA